jgi:hypothetical protein
MLNESLVKSREEQQEFDNKMMQVTNLLKELKNNSSSGHTGFTSNPPTLQNHFEENSLKVQDLERTLSLTN